MGHNETEGVVLFVSLYYALKEANNWFVPPSTGHYKEK